MNVLFLTRYPLAGASSRYRVHQYLPHLEAMGVNCRVQAFMDDALYRMSLAPGRTMAKMAASSAAILRRLRTVAGAGAYDLVYLQRELLPLGPPVIERRLGRSPTPLIFDIDDALFLHKPSRFTPLASLLRAPGKARELFRLADCVVTGNDWLRDQAAEAGARAVTIEVAEDTRRIAMHPGHTNARPVTIGWLGSPSTAKYLTALAPVLRRLAAEYPALRFEIMGAGPFAMEGVPWQSEPWSLAGELAALARFDIGLMPLPTEPWALGKSGGKARTYMAAGIVPVVSGLGYNTELITQGETGFLCQTPEDWDAALRQSLNDPDLRNRIARSARRAVEDRFHPVTQATKLKSLFEDVLAQRKAAA